MEEQTRQAIQRITEETVLLDFEMMEERAQLLRDLFPPLKTLDNWQAESEEWVRGLLAR